MKTNKTNNSELTFGDVENIINKELEMALPRIKKSGEENPSSYEYGCLKIEKGVPIRKYFEILPFEKTCEEAYSTTERFLNYLPGDFSGYNIILGNSFSRDTSEWNYWLGKMGVYQFIYGIPNEELVRLSRIYAGVTWDEENGVKFFDSKSNPIKGNPVKGGYESQFKEDCSEVILSSALGNCSDLIYDSKGIDNIFKEMIQKNGYLISEPMSFSHGTRPIRSNDPFVYQAVFDYKGFKGVINFVSCSDLLDEVLSSGPVVHREDISGWGSD